MANKFQVSTLILSRQHVTATGNLLYVNGLLVGSGIYQPTGDYALNSDLVASGLQLLGIIENSGQQNWLYTSGAYVDIFNTGSLLDGKINSLSGYSDLTFATVSNLQSTGSALDNKINSLSGFTNLLSGGLEVRLVQTGNSAVNHANGIGQNLSGNLTQTGANLILRDNDISGVLQTQINELYPRTNPSGYITGISTGEFVTRNETGQFASVTSLFNSGVTLTSTIINSGNAAITHANGIGSILSGKLTETGVLLGAQINSLSGFTLGASGALQAQIGSAGAQVRVTGSSSISIADFTGIGGLLIFTSGGQIFVSGGAASSTLNHGDGINLSGNLTQTGITLNNKIDSLSGFTLGLSGGLENRITQTGNGAVLHANGIGINLSGNLTQSGIQLGNKIDVLSGYSNTTFATIATVNLVSGNLIQTGIQLGGKIDSLSGFTLGVSGDLQLKINELYPRSNPSGYITGISTGNFVTRTETGQFYPASNPQQYVTSGNLFATGSTLDNKINSLSGFTINVSGGLETRLFQTGNSAVVHANGIGINLSGNLTNTGVTLLNTIVQSGNASVNHANGIGINLSGNLTQTGATLNNRITSLSGFTLGASGALQAQIVGGAGTEVRITGSDTLSIANFTGLGSVSVVRNGDNVLISGSPSEGGGITQGQLDSVSGWTDTFFVHRLGNELISGSKTFTSATTISGRLHQGLNVLASTTYGHAQGDNTRALGSYSHAEGRSTSSSAAHSHAEGYDTIASGVNSHTEGYQTITFGDASHAEGSFTRAFGSHSHAEGFGSISSGNYSHAEGNVTRTFGLYSHAEGLEGQALGDYSHAEGQFTRAIGVASHAEGLGTIVDRDYSHAVGIRNRTGVSGLFQVGRGSSDENRDDLIYVSDRSSNASILSGRWHFETGAQVGGHKILTGLVAGTNVTINNNNDGTFTVNSVGSSDSDGINLSGNLTQTGIQLGAKIDSLSGYSNNTFSTITTTNLISGDIIQTGNSAIAHSNGIGINLSGSLTQTGIQLGAKIDSLSGYSNSTFSTIATTNLISGNLTQTGVNLILRDIAVSGGLEARIIQTGNSSVLHSNGIGINLSGNLTNTGVSLINRDISISGGLEARITQSGNNAISHANGIGTSLSGNLTNTGSVLDNRINSLSGFASAPRGITAVIDGGGEVITTGIKMHLPIPFNCTVNNWTILGDVAGSIVVDVQNATYANFPTTTSIAGTEKPTLSAAQKNQDLSLTTWSTPITGGNILSFLVESATTVQFVTVQLGITIT